MALELRTPKGRPILLRSGRAQLGDEAPQTYDEVLLDGEVIGLSFHGDCAVHWTVPKKDLPQKVITQTVWMLQSRNLRQRQMAM